MNARTAPPSRTGTRKERLDRHKLNKMKFFPVYLQELGPNNETLHERRRTFMSTNLRFSALISGLLLLAGCTMASSDLSETGKYSIQIEPGTVSVSTTAKVYRDQEDFVVAGEVKKLHEFRLPG